MNTKETATKFWVGLVFALVTTASTLGLPGWWGKSVAIAAALVGAAGVYLADNKPIATPTNPPEVHSGQ